MTSASTPAPSPAPSPSPTPQLISLKDKALHAIRLSEKRLWRESLEVARELTQADPLNPMAWQLVSTAGLMCGSLEESLAASIRITELSPNHIGGLLNEAVCLFKLERREEAIAKYRRLLHTHPDDPYAYTSFVLDGQQDPSVSLAEIVEVAKGYGRLMTATAQAHPLLYPLQVTPEPWRKLRLGFVSPDVAVHPVMYFLEPLLVHLDRSQFEIYIYATQSLVDHVTERVQRMVDCFINVVDLKEHQLADRIRLDRIDVLWDVAGHTMRTGVGAFAWQPAPVQVTWLGYPGTTGLAEVNWRLSDGVADIEPRELASHGLPPEAWEGLPDLQAQYSEKLVMLPDLFCVYRPHIKNVMHRYTRSYQVQPTPALTQGHITFGSCNRLTKISDEVLHTWGRILEAVPNSRLFLEGAGLSQPALRQTWIARLSRCGLNPERVILANRDTAHQYLVYHCMDIALDTFPLTGGTSTFDTLWMGVPLVTLEGTSFRSRMSTAILQAFQRGEWVAPSLDAYVARAVALAQDIPQLNQIRLEQRGRMLASPLMNEARFTRFVEEAVRYLWLDWCVQQHAGADVAAQHEQLQTWVAQKPAPQPIQRWVFDTAGTPRPLAEALQHLDAAWRLAMQVEATKPSRHIASTHQGVTGVVGSKLLRPHWWEAVKWGLRILETHPTHPQALVVLAEAEWAHGCASQALLLLTQAWNLTTPSRALTERVRQWLNAMNLEAELTEFDRVTLRRGVPGPAPDPQIRVL